MVKHAIYVSNPQAVAKLIDRPQHPFTSSRKTVESSVLERARPASYESKDQQAFASVSASNFCQTQDAWPCLRPHCNGVVHEFHFVYVVLFLEIRAQSIAISASEAKIWSTKAGR